MNNYQQSESKVQVRSFSEVDVDSDEVDQFEPIQCHEIIKRQFSRIINANDKGVPYHVTFE